MRKKREFSEAALDLIGVYRNNPVLAAQDLLGIDLDTIQKIIIHEMWFKSYTIVTAGRGCGKSYLLSVVSALYALLYPGKKVLIMSPSFRQCVVGNTLVVTENGFEYVGELKERPNRLLSSCGVQNVLGHYKNLPEPTIKIVTSGGYTIEGALDHRVLSVSNECGLVYKKLSGINKDTYMCVLPGSERFGSEVELSSFIPCFKPKGNLRDINIPSKLSYDLSYFLGLLVGDGCLTKKNQIEFINTDVDLLSKYDKICTRYFGRPCITTKSDGVTAIVKGSKLGYEFLGCIGMAGKSAGTKTIPGIILRTIKKNQCAFIRGFFDTDGCVYFNSKVNHPYKLHAASISEKLIDQLQILLLNMGVVAVKCFNNSQRENTLYCLEVSNKDSILKYYENIGFGCVRKQDKLRAVVDYINSTDINRHNKDIVPYASYVVSSIVKEIREAGGSPFEYLHLYSYFDLDSKPKKAHLTKNFIRKVLDYCDKNFIFMKETEYLKSVFEKGFIFLKVVSIDAGFDYTYDFTVEGTHDYFSNGFISHNSKGVFDELKRRYTESPILREACVKKPIIGSDRCYLDFYGVDGRAGSNVSAFPLGDGCVVSSSLLTVNSGIRSIGDLVPTQDIFKEHQIFPYNECVWSNGDFRFSDEKYYNGIRPVKRINTKKGYSFAGTLNHKIKISREGEVVLEQLENINEGDWVLIDRSSRWFPDVDVSVTEEKAYALGLLIGDGCWVGKTKIGFATKDKELIGYLNEAFLEKGFTQCSDKVHYNLYSSKIRKDWLDFWGMGSLYTKDKFLPGKLLGASKENVAACISGLYDADGHVQVGTKDGGVGITVGFTNTSEKLVDQIQYILLHFGIISTKLSRDRNEKWNTVYELFITGIDVLKFSESIGFRLARKNKKLLNAISKKSRFFTLQDYIPGQLKEAIEYRKNNRVRRGQGGKHSKECRVEFLRKTKELPRRRAKYLCKTYKYKNDAFIKKLNTLLDDNIYYDYVVSTSFSEEPTYDLHIPEGHEYGVNGFFSHNSRIRGLRGHFILVDEFAQVPEDIFEMVIRPMGAATASPMENVRRLQMLKEKLEDGILSMDEYETERAGMQTNKIIGVTSAYYQFNHVYRRIQKYQEEIDKGSDKYGLCSVSYEDMSEGFLDQNNVAEAKVTMSRIEFNLEYRGIWESDSDGVFKASLLEKSKSRACPVRLKGEVGKKYVIGLDPARSSDAFAVAIIEVGNPSFLVHAFQTTGEKFPKMAQIIYEFCEKFDTLIAMMDAGSGGGGVAIKDILSSEQFSKGHLILDMDDEEHKDLKGKKILRMHDPRPKAIAEANYAALNLLEQELLRLPYPPTDGDEDKEVVFDDIKEMLNQMMLITITETKSGLAHFDIPSSGKGSRKKDLYSAFILAAKGLYDTVIAREEETYYINQGGLVIPVDRAHKAPMISNVMRLPGR